MDVKTYLQEITALAGVPGLENDVGNRVAEGFRPLCNSVEIDNLGNVIARKGENGPVIMLCAHMDEVGMYVSAIEDDGCIRIRPTGGVDPRILPAHEVTIKARGGDVYGIVGAKAPHLLKADERDKVVNFTNLYVDIGYDAETVRKMITIGDVVVYNSPLLSLEGGFIAGKTFDDRAGVAAMMVCAEKLDRLRANAQAVFVASTQEEIGSNGARVSAWSVNPDVAIAIDATFANGTTSSSREIDPDKIEVAMGPNIHPALYKKLIEIAGRYRINVVTKVYSGGTGTDAWQLQTARDGIPTLLVSIPVRYMHTSVETVKVSTIENTGELLAHFIDDIAREWEDIQWY